MPNIASLIDHTILKAEATVTEVRQLVAEAIEHGFASVCVNGCFAGEVATLLRGSAVKACGVVGFPLGAMKVAIKAIEAGSLAKDGAGEIDFVAHLPSLLSQNFAAAKAECVEIVRAARAANAQVIVKAIVESAALMKDVDAATAEARIELACRAVRESGCDFIKTSTGFHPAGGATVEAVRLMRKHSGGLQVKASGGIRSYDDARRMIDAGADRLGCSASVAIVHGAKPATAGY